MLGSPLGAVVGATDIAATVAFLQGFDLSVVATDHHGVDLASAERGRVRVVRAPTGLPRGPYDGGLAALDFYARTLGDLPAVRIDLGPLVMHQTRLTGPDGLPVVLIDANHRRPSRMDTSDAAFSEAHSLVWVVPDVSATTGVLRRSRPVGRLRRHAGVASGLGGHGTSRARTGADGHGQRRAPVTDAAGALRVP